ncbi:MAG: 2-amino-4-hydroxy-6-hydroxymethyldihydropteridine diphosphokinase [Rhodoluna sp.]|nr:2-amino-4-hydroxy-6-hydroxymethyldihydropteridine diphosphokinase [Rhodoluna sp.]
MTICVLALGSNLGNRRNWLIKALSLIATTKDVYLTDISPIVESKALTLAGVDSSKPKFLNCVTEIETSLKPEELLRQLQAIELELGRKRKERWGDRNIDIDIITYGNTNFRSPELVIPHPETKNRSFVIVPWYLMDQNATLPGVGRIEKLAEVFVDQVKLY